MLCDQGTICRDTDCDTICDIDEGDAERRDTDHDGVPDFLDQDSDNDSISDHDEAGDDDPATKPFDRDENGIPDYLDPLYPLHPHHHSGDGGEGGGGMDASPPPSAAGTGGMSAPAAGSGDEQPPTCPSERWIAEGCTIGETGAAACDGLDNDCDGRIDDDNVCECARGAVRSCFLGPPARSAIGACQTGVQHCVGEEFSHWAACEGSVEPSAERCDGLDNDCNGCADDLPSCAAQLSCPAPNDPRTPDATPYAPYALDATLFYPGTDVWTYRWTITGSPCDRLFHALDSSATEQSGKQSFVLLDPSSARTEAFFTLSGSYRVSLVITTPSGELRCDFEIHVRAQGLRIELCWDKTGPLAAAAGDAVDLDLHLAKAGETAQFQTASDCYWQTCRGDMTPWNYDNTTSLTRCTGPSAQNYAAYVQLGFCPNPRLDADNRLDARSRAAYITENINLDNPRLGDRFRIAVQYNENVLSDVSDNDAGAPHSIATRPLVNVYCAGELRGSFGGDPEQREDREELMLAEPGQLWRVADIVVSQTGCDLQPLSDPMQSGRYWLTQHDSSYGAQ